MDWNLALVMTFWIFSFPIHLSVDRYCSKDGNLLIDTHNLEISGYSLVRFSHSHNKKGGEVCVYYKNFLPLKVLDIQYLHECINFELKTCDKLFNFVVLYISPSQTQDEFEKFSDNLELSQGTFSQKKSLSSCSYWWLWRKSKSWYINDSTTSHGNVLENITSQFGLQQIIKKPTHILDNCFLCTDLTFISQPNLITESGVYPSFHPDCHHQVVYAEFNLEIYHPLQYYREIWHYKDTNIELIRHAIDGFNWQNSIFQEKMLTKE